jgi:hypothetical protein
MELTPMIGVGASDLQHAIRAEVDLPNCLQRSKPLVGASGLPASSPLVPSRPTCPAAGGRGGDHGPFSR